MVVELDVVVVELVEDLDGVDVARRFLQVRSFVSGGFVAVAAVVVVAERIESDAALRLVVRDGMVVADVRVLLIVQVLLLRGVGLE